MTDDAKKFVKKRQSKLPTVAKIASIAASLVLVVAVGAVLVSRSGFLVGTPDNPPSSGDTNDAQTPVYGTSEIVYTEYSAYTASKADPSLKFIENLAYSQNAQVNSLYVATFADGTKANAYADISVIDDTRHDTQIFVEYAEATFEPLLEYSEGTQGSYRGLSYYLTTETDEASGEPVNKLLISYAGIKYYFKITSSDVNSYLKYLQMFA